MQVHSLTLLLQKLSQKQQRFSEQLAAATERMIADLRRQTRELEEEVCLRYLSPEELKALEGIYLGGGQSLTGSTAKDLYRRLKQVHQET